MVVASEAPATTQDSWIESDLMRQVYLAHPEAKYPIGDLSVAVWEKGRPLPMDQIYTSYQGDPKHPLVQARQN